MFKVACLCLHRAHDVLQNGPSVPAWKSCFPRIVAMAGHVNGNLDLRLPMIS
uniref:Uncharacterized protein n=1 Tax=Arundo donax TaxID=35708 RepID=A0A0A9F7W4_ARUDO